MRDAERVRRELWKLPSAVHGIGIHQVGRKNLRVAVLPRVQIEHEVREGALELCSQVPINREASTSQLHGTFQIKHSQLLRQFPVRLGSEVELRRLAPTSDFNILLGTMADGNTGMRKVGNAGENLAQPRIKITRSFFPALDLVLGGIGLLDPLAQFFGLRHGGAGILSRFFQFRDLFGSLVAPRLTGFLLRDGLASLRVNRAEILEHRSRIHAALAQLLLHQRQIVTDEVQIEHGN